MRVIAVGLRPEQTIASKIMTRNPTFVTSDSLAIDAMHKMVQGIFLLGLLINYSLIWFKTFNGCQIFTNYKLNLNTRL